MAFVLVLGTLFSCWWNLGLASVVDAVTDGGSLAVAAGAPDLVPGRHRPGGGARRLAGRITVATRQRDSWRWAGCPACAGRPPRGCSWSRPRPWVGRSSCWWPPRPSPWSSTCLRRIRRPRRAHRRLHHPESGRYARMMSQRWLRHLGHISYSTFCIHLVVLHGVRAILDHQLFAGDGLLLWGSDGRAQPGGLRGALPLRGEARPAPEEPRQRRR